MAATDLTRRVYLIGPWRRWALWWALGPFLILGIGFCFSQDEAERMAGGVLILLMGTMLALWQWLVTRTRLELSSEGVRLRQLGMNLQAPWSAITELRTERRREGFVTSVALEGRGAARLAAASGFGSYGTPLYNDEQRALIQMRRWIPLEAFGWHLRKGKLATDIAAFAPHLARGLEGQPAGRGGPTAQPLSRWRVALIVTIILVALGLGIGLLFAPPHWGAWFFAIAMAVCAPLAVVRAAWSTRNSYRARAWLLCALFVLLTLIALGWCTLAWSELEKLMWS